MHVPMALRSISSLTVAALLALSVWLPSCKSSETKNTTERRKLTPADFAVAPGERTAPSRHAQASAGPPAAPVTDASPAALGAPPQAAGIDPGAVSPSTAGGFDPPPAVMADAMVGQVNGRAIYASQVLAPIAPQLKQLGQTASRSEFHRQASNLVRGEILRIVTDALILGEAERDLNQQEQYGLLAMLQIERQKLLNQYGEGALSVAEQKIIAETSRTLEQTVEDKRAQLLVSRYMQLKLYPKINVTKKDIRRYYQDHASDFNPPVVRTIRLIVANTPAAADAVDSSLGEGKSFIEVARSKHNSYKPEQGGLFLEDAKGDVIFGDDRDDALRQLAVGQCSPRIDKGTRSYWIFVEKLEQPPGIPLSEAGPGIEQTLRVQRYQKLSEQYREELFKKGSYAPLDKMSLAVLDVAMSRYAPAAPK